MVAQLESVSEDLDIAIAPVIEDLADATAKKFTPLHLYPNDWLRIGLDDEGKNFNIETVALQRADATDPCAFTIGDDIFKISRFPASGSSEQIYKRIPECKPVKKGSGMAAAMTDFTVLVIHHCWPKTKVYFDTVEAEQAYKLLLFRFLRQSFAKTIVANFKVHKKLPDMPRHFFEHPRLPLADYQKAAFMSAYNEPAAALFMEQGTGKTAVAVTTVCVESADKMDSATQQVKAMSLLDDAAIASTKAKLGMYRVLVVCPRQVRKNWEREFARFALNPGKIGIIQGDLHRRVRAITDCARSEEGCYWSVAIISTDSVDATMAALRLVEWDKVILDESHYIKDDRSNRSKALRFLARVGAKSRLALTGTPIANTLMDLYPQFEFLGRGLSGFSNFKAFRRFHGKFETVDSGAKPIQKLIGMTGIPLIQERLARLSFLITKEEAGIKLPNKVYDLHEVEMTAKQAKIYKALSDKLVAEIEQDVKDQTKTISVDHILTKLLRLAQITSGFVKVDGSDTVEQIDKINPKVQAVYDMITDPARDGKGKTIIWCCFKEDVRAISEFLAANNIKHVGYHDEIVKEYRVPTAEDANDVINTDDDCIVFIGNPKSAAEGLNILGYDPENPEASEKYVDHVIYVSCNWSPLERGQSEARAHRRGTRMPVRVTDLIVPCTIDEEIRAAVAEKRQVAFAVQDLTDLLKRVASNSGRLAA